MSATRIVRLATVVGFCAGWLVAAVYLWRTSVPGAVDVGGLDDRWWLVGAPIFVVISAAFALLFGYVAQIGTHPLDPGQVRSDVRALERREGVTGTPVHIQEVSSYTNQANAYANGVGPSA